MGPPTEYNGDVYMCRTKTVLYWWNNYNVDTDTVEENEWKQALTMI